MNIMITGAGNGIGFFMSEALLEAGSNVAVLDITHGGIRDLEERFGEAILACVPCDVTSEEQVQGAVRRVIEKWGRIDVLVNNACMAVFAPFEQRTLEDIKREFDVNLYGYLRLIKAVAPLMKAAGGGVIHNMSSGVGITGIAGMTGYTASKGAIEAVTRTLAIELEPHGVTVNLMHPPLTRTISSSGLGVPAEAMADPAAIGRKLARKVGSRKELIVPDMQTALYLWAARRFPLSIGRLFSRLSQRARNQQR